MHKILAEPVSILMPVCNEQDIIELVVKEWIEEVCCHLPDGSELVFDDCSTDGTNKILCNLAEKFPYIRVQWSPKDGFFRSAMRLYRAARCPLIFFTDSDGQYPPEEFWRIAPLINTCDMVHGAKMNRCDPFYRVFASGVFNFIGRRLFHTKGTDINSAFRLMRKNALDAILGSVHVMPTLINAEIYLRMEHAGYLINDINVRHRKRLYGKSRGLPLGHFAKECFHASRGLLRLRDELNKTPPRPLKKLAA